MYIRSTFLRAFMLVGLLLFSAGLPGHGQPADTIPKNPWVLGLRTHYGFIIPHAIDLREVSDTHPVGLTFEASRHLNNAGVWDQCSCYPKVGMSLSYFNFNNPEVLGNALNAIGWFEPYIGFRGRLRPSFRMGLGLSYLNRLYDAQTNPTNTFFSSPISFFLLANLGVNYALNERLSLHLSGSFNHISNGGISQPNKGMNFPVLNLGVDYSLQPLYLPNRQAGKSLDELFPERTRLKVGILGGMKEASSEEEEKYPVFGAFFTLNRVVGKVSALSGGLEFLSDGSIRERNRRGITNGQPEVLAGLVGHEFLMGRFTFSQHLGIYFNKPQPTTDRLFQRWGLAYAVGKKWEVGLNLKAHRHVADVLDLRLSSVF